MLEPNSHTQVTHTHTSVDTEKQAKHNYQHVERKDRRVLQSRLPAVPIACPSRVLKLRALSAWRLGTLHTLTHAALTTGTVIMSSHGRRSLFLANEVRRVSQSLLEPLERSANVRADHRVLWRQHVALGPVQHLFRCSRVGPLVKNRIRFSPCV